MKDVVLALIHMPLMIFHVAAEVFTGAAGLWAFLALASVLCLFAGICHAAFRRWKGALLFLVPFAFTELMILFFTVLLNLHEDGMKRLMFIFRNPLVIFIPFIIVQLSFCIFMCVKFRWNAAMLSAFSLSYAVVNCFFLMMLLFVS